jgi:hypothetical protein
MLRAKKLEVRKKKKVKSVEEPKKPECHEIEPNPWKDIEQCMREIVLRFEMNL